MRRIIKEDKSITYRIGSTTRFVVPWRGASSEEINAWIIIPEDTVIKLISEGFLSDDFAIDEGVNWLVLSR
ncbi:MAG: hypothetical protein EU981_03735 [Candidatus Liberibacter ctenarytainae]|uniref:Uncharacterized protein n=1 Tax=Candidatus Liberibacter ctenarytainae TaxID=2020335 RepID=A0A937AK73_9HYPH|nr:hypothetical protein [Candidatus Liberibacter ctenarytainae]